LKLEFVISKFWKFHRVELDFNWVHSKRPKNRKFPFFTLKVVISTIKFRVFLSIFQIKNKFQNNNFLDKFFFKLYYFSFKLNFARTRKTYFHFQKYTFYKIYFRPFTTNPFNFPCLIYDGRITTRYKIWRTEVKKLWWPKI
jgi:hypothetical protein